MLKHLNENEFENNVVKNNGVVLVDFFATWCPPCKMLGPVLEEISNSRAPFDIVKVNIDENSNLSSKYEIEVVPTMLVFKNGKVVDKAVGYMDKSRIIDMVNKHID
jgi:thioredoxin 1